MYCYYLIVKMRLTFIGMRDYLTDQSQVMESSLTSEITDTFFCILHSAFSINTYLYPTF